MRCWARFVSPCSIYFTIKNYNENVRCLKNFKKNISFQLSIYSLRWIKMECKRKKYMQKGRDKNNKKNKSKVKSIVFFLNNSHLIYTFLFCFCSSFLFLSRLFLHTFYPFAFHFYPWRAVDRQPKAHVLFETF